MSCPLNSDKRCTQNSVMGDGGLGDGGGIELMGDLRVQGIVMSRQLRVQRVVG